MAAIPHRRTGVTATVTGFVSFRQADAAVSCLPAAATEIGCASMYDARPDTALLLQRFNEDRLPGSAAIRTA